MQTEKQITERLKACRALSKEYKSDWEKTQDEGDYRRHCEFKAMGDVLEEVLEVQ